MPAIPLTDERHPEHGGVAALIAEAAELDGRIIARQARAIDRLTTELDRVRSDSDDDFNHAVELFNPRDDDCTTTMSVLDQAHAALEAIPCTCPLGASADFASQAEEAEDLDSCERCQGLGRRANVRLSR